MNIFEQEDLIKGLPDQSLMQEAQRPSGQLPQYLVVSEIQRRQDMRKRFSQQGGETPQGTVKDQILGGGIAELGQQPPGQPPQQGPGMPPPQGGMPPQGPMPQQMGMPQQPPMGMPQQPPMPMPQQMAMPPQAPMGMPPQGMAAGGVVRMYAGQQAPNTAGDLELAAGELERLANPMTMAQISAANAAGKPHPLYGGSVLSQLLSRDPQQEESSGMTMAEISAANAAGKPHPIYGDSAISQLFDKIGEGGEYNREDLLAIAEEQSGENEAQQEFFAGQKELEIDRSPLPLKSGLLLDTDAIKQANREERQRREGLLQVSTTNNNAAIVTDAGKAGSGRNATQLDQDLVEVGASDTDAQGQVDKDLSKGKSDSPINYESLIAQLSTRDDVDSPDYSGALGNLAESAKISDALKSNTSGFADLIGGFTKPSMDFSSLKPDYAALISEAERRAGKIKEDARKDAGAQALMQLGAGIAEGSVSAGLRGASKVTGDIMRQARAEASAESTLARRMEMAGKEAQMNLGLKGQQAAIDNYDRQVSLAARDYGDQRAREFQAAGMDADAAVAKAGIEMKAADALYAKNKDQRDSAIDAVVKQATILRYQDLEKQSGRALNRQTIQMVQQPIRTAIEDWRLTNSNATPEQLGAAIEAIAGRFLTLDVATGQGLLTGSMPSQGGLGAVSFDSLVTGTP